VMGLFSWSHIWIYLLANCAGGAAAALVFRLTQPDPEPDLQPVAAPRPAESRRILRREPHPDGPFDVGATR